MANVKALLIWILQFLSGSIIIFILNMWHTNSVAMHTIINKKIDFLSFYLNIRILDELTWLKSLSELFFFGFIIMNY